MTCRVTDFHIPANGSDHVTLSAAKRFYISFPQYLNYSPA
jgi:hypothetical protein